MSVKGFLVGQQIEKYDYNALDNIPENDYFPESFKEALLQFASKVAYVDSHGEEYYQALYDSLTAKYFNVTNFFVGCHSSNNSSTIKEQSRYTATISVNKGYVLNDEMVQVIMGGENVTNTAYKNGSINIANVTGDLVIYATAVSAISSISATYTQQPDSLITMDPTVSYTWITQTSKWNTADDSACVCVPVTPGKRYRLEFTETDSTLVGTIFRFGFSDSNTPNNQQLYSVVRNYGTTDQSPAVTPQNYHPIEVIAPIGYPYLVIQLAKKLASSIISNNYLTLTEVGDIVYENDSLNSLLNNLVVTATYLDGSIMTIPSEDCVLTGGLILGTSTITVSYGGKATTFQVNVSSPYQKGVALLRLTNISRACRIPSQVGYSGAAALKPIANNHNTYTVTDESKYSINAMELTENIEMTDLTYVALDKIGYRSTISGASWGKTFTRTSAYVWIGLRKEDGTDFTDAELANGAAAVFTIT